MKNWQIILILAILTFLFFWPTWINGLPLIFGDNLYMFFPLKQFSMEILRQGNFPFWNPYIFSGFPLFASSQVGIFYPLNVLYFMLPISIAFTTDIILTYFIAALGMYLLCKRLTDNKFASLCSGIAFCFSSFMLFKMENLPIIHEISLIPLILFFLIRANKSYFNINTIIATVLLSIQYFSGHPQICFLTILIIFCHQLLSFLFVDKDTNRTYYISNTLIIITFSLLIAAVQLIPTIELALESKRIGFSYDEYCFGSLPPVAVFSLLFPYIYGGVTDNGFYQCGLFNQFDSIGNFCIYIGILPLFFAIFAAIKNKMDINVRIWVIISIIGFLLALGYYFPVHYLLHKIPVFNFFRYPVRYILLFNIALCILTSFGIVEIFKLEKKSFITFIKYLAIGVFVTSIISLIFLQRVNSSEISEDISLLSMNIILPVVIIALSFVTLIIYYFNKSKTSSILLVLVIIIDLVVSFGQFAGWKSYAAKQSVILKKTPAVAAYLRNNLENYERFLTLYKEKPENLNEFNLVEPDYSMLFNIHSINGYDVLTPKRYTAMLNTLITGKKPFLKLNTSSQLDNILSCKYIVCRKNRAVVHSLSPDTTLVYNKYNYQIYENKNTLFKAIIVNSYKTFENYRDVLEYIKNNNSWDPLKVALIEKEYLKNLSIKPSKKKIKTRISILKYYANEVILKTNSSTDGILILNDNYYPIWKAYIDGNETKIFPVNVSLRGIEITRGNHEVVFKIDDKGFSLGLIISIISLITLIAAFISYKRKTK